MEQLSPGHSLRHSDHCTKMVAEAERILVGTAMVGEDGHRGWIYYLAADPQWQRRGVGRALMGAAEKWLRRRGVWKLNLLVRRDNLDATGFYQRLGFSETETVCLQKHLVD